MPVKTAKASPKDHASTHAIGGSDEVTDIGSHASRHAVGGADAISDLATHASRHESGGADEVTGVVPSKGDASQASDIALAADTEEFLYEVSVSIASGLTLHLVIIEFDYSSPSVNEMILRVRRGGTSATVDGTILDTWDWIDSWDGPKTVILMSTGAPTGTVLYKATSEVPGKTGTVTARAGSKITVVALAE